MARNVYVWPTDLVVSASYSPPSVLRQTVDWQGATGQAVEHVQRSVVTLEGVAMRSTAADFDIMVDRLRGGANLVAVCDMAWRIRNGWDDVPALDASGNEYWRADGQTSNYPTGTYRSVDVTGTGSSGGTSLSITGLQASETVPKGAWVRIGDYRHRTLTAVTANGSGAATLTLASPLRSAISSGTVTIPGDLFVGVLRGFEMGAEASDGLRRFRVVLAEVYSDEVTGGFTWLGL